jgi:hypothetical protein
MKTNDIKKGMRIVLNNGWEATMYDNARGNIRLAEVEGFYTEIGSIYAHDIAAVRVDGTWLPVTLTPAQLKLRGVVEAVL